MWLGDVAGIKSAQDDSVFLGVLELWLWLGDTTGIKRTQDDSVFFGVLESWLWLGDATGIKRAQDDSVFFEAGCFFYICVCLTRYTAINHATTH